MKNTYSKLVFSNDEGVYLKLVTDISIYWRGSVFEHAEGVMNFYQQALDLIGHEIKYFRTESMNRPKKIKSTTLELLPHWMINKKKQKGIYMLSLESGLDEYEPSDKAFYFLADEEESTKTGIIRLILPASFMDGGILDVLPLLEKLLVNFNFESGHAGFAVNWDPEGESEDEAARKMAVLAKKYPGIDLNYVDSTVIAFENSSTPSIKCSNWLTMIGSGICSSLPTTSEMRTVLGDVCQIHEIPKGLIFQAGAIPKLGYPDRIEMNPYRMVGGLLADFRLRNHPQIFAESSTDEFSTEDWLGRFDH